MNTNIDVLSKKTCISCKSGDLPLTPQEYQPFLNQLNSDWRVNQKGHLCKEYVFNNFKSPMDFANKIAIIAEHENHHPNITISWGKCILEIWTHKIVGLSERDFILAAKIEKI